MSLPDASEPAGGFGHGIGRAGARRWARAMAGIGRWLRPAELPLQELLNSRRFMFEIERMSHDLAACHIVVTGASRGCGTTSVAVRLAFALARRAEEANRLADLSRSIAVGRPGEPETALLSGTKEEEVADDGAGSSGEQATDSREPLAPTHPLLMSIRKRYGSGRVLLAEANLRDPSLARDLGMGIDVGLNQWDLQSRLPAMSAAGVPQLSLLFGGSPSDEHGGFSAMTRLSAAVERARADFDFVVWDAPPVTECPEILALSARADGVLVVVELNETRQEELALVRENLTACQGRVLGSVVNRIGRYWPRPPRRRLSSPAVSVVRPR